MRLSALPAGNSADDEQRLGAGTDRGGERRIGCLVRPVARAGEEANKGPALERHVIAHRATQDRIAGLERIEHGTRRGWVGNVEYHFTVYARQRLQVVRQLDTNHDSVCTSTDSTGGRSRTIAVQWSPPSGDAYT